MTKQEYSVLLQTLAEDRRTAEILVSASRAAENDLAVTLRLKTGETAALHTWGEFIDWYSRQRSAQPPEQQLTAL